MLNRRSFIIRSAATTAAATIAVTSQAEAKEVAVKGKGSAAKAGALASIPMDAAKSKSIILEAYRKHAAERAAMGIPPLPLSPEQVAAVAFLLRNPPKGEEAFLLDLITHRVPPGVYDASRVKADFLSAIALGKDKSPVISRQKATELLGTMQGGYNVQTLVALLNDKTLGTVAAAALKKTILMFGAFNDVKALAAKGNPNAKAVMRSWAEAEWFTVNPEVPKSIKLTVFKLAGETNTGDLSPDPDANTRADIPLHALSMMKFGRPGVTPDEVGKRGPMKQLDALRAKGNPIVFAGDVLGPGSSRKSATNNVIWWTGKDIPFVPNKRYGGFVFGGKLAPIFYNTMQDSGALPIEMDVSRLEMGDVVELRPYEGKVLRNGEVVAQFKLKTEVLLDAVRAGGRIPLVIGRKLTDDARKALGMAPSTLFRKPKVPVDTGKGFTLAQKVVGLACGLPRGKGIRPGTYCEPKMSTVGSQDTTGTLTRDEIMDLACLKFSADLVMESFCHTNAYPKPSDVKLHATLPKFFTDRNGVALRVHDGVLHTWLNRMAIPETVGSGGDSHTRYPLGVYFPAGSGLVAFGAATGFMPLDMPESVLVRFKGEMQPGVTLRDLVNAIPYYAFKQGHMTIEKKGKKNVFSGRILEIEGLPNLTPEQAFEISDSTAERSAEACMVRLNKEPIVEYMKSNVALLKWMVANGYQDRNTLQRRIKEMEAWLKNPQIMEPDADAEYAAIIEIDLAEITEPLLACPNDPDDIKPLSAVAGTKVDETFIGSCQVNIGHFRAAAHLLKGHPGIPTRLWIVPPSKMDADLLNKEGYFAEFGAAGARIEPPGCSLCFGNQARARPNTTVVSTSTRNFNNRMGTGTKVFLASPELTAITAWMGKLPTKAEYLAEMKKIEKDSAKIYRYLNFHKMPEYKV